MDAIQPDLEWYTTISANMNLSPRCPFASVHRCPRYFESVSLLGQAGVSTSIDPGEETALVERWKRSDLWPVVAEHASQVMGPENQPRHFHNFCPEVSFENFRWFASHLSGYSDEIDADVAHGNLVAEGAAGTDWRWIWAWVKPIHYTGCSLYSPLLMGVNETKSKTPFGFHVTE